jgi:hypothetical protein
MHDSREADETSSPARTAQFEQLARRAARGAGNPLAEFWYFLGRTRKWWMLPILGMLLLVGTLVVMAGTAVGPLIYALF